MNWEQIKNQYPSDHGIVLAIPDWESHIKAINEKIKYNPGWYANDQVEAQYKGPYRVHLERRRNYLKKTINNYHTTHYPTPNTACRIIDIGCGDGQHLQWLQNFYNVELYGSDYNLLRLRRIQRNPNITPSIKLLLMNILGIPFDNNYFHVILCNHVLEHIKDDSQAFREIARILSPDGVLILGVPNEGSKWWQLAYDLEPNLREISDHIHFYTAEKIHKLISYTDLKCIETKWMGYGLPHFTADSIFRNIDGMDDIMEKIGQTYFKEQASSLYFIIQKK